MSRALKLVTFAVPLSGNKGSASMFLGLRDAFRRTGSEVEFQVFSYYPKRDQRFAEDWKDVSVLPGHPKDIAFRLLPGIVLDHILPGFVPRPMRDAILALKECDGVLMMGGTTFADSMLYKVPWNVLAALPGFWYRKPTLFLSQTLGPFQNRWNHFAARWTLRRALEVHGRGRESADHVAHLGVSAVSFQPDLSFAMEVPSLESLADKVDTVHDLLRALADGKTQAVGIAPNAIVFQKARKAGKDYIAFLRLIITEIDRRGFLPVLIPHSYLPDRRALHNNDRGICEAIMQELPSTIRCIHVDADLPPPELRALIGRMHLLVSSRFHSMISALAMNVPPITYGWGSQKYREVLTEFGVAELYSSYQELDATAFSAKLDYAHSQRADLYSKISRARLEQERLVGDLPARIVSALSPDAAALTPDPTQVG